MAKLSVSERDFELVACLALDAESRGDMDDAIAADRLARRISAALTVAKSRDARFIVRMATSKDPSNFTWEQVPTLLGRAVKG